jgi:hypothetical protein
MLSARNRPVKPAGEVQPGRIGNNSEHGILAVLKNKHF